MADAVIAILATLNTKHKEVEFIRETLSQAGVIPWVVDISLRPHDRINHDVSGDQIAASADTTWSKLALHDRTRAAEFVILGGQRILLSALARGELSGAIGLGGANGTSIACTLMRALPLSLPKVMVSPVAATAAVQWYVAESDIAMFSSIGDISMNRITKAVLGNAAEAVAAMAKKWAKNDNVLETHSSLIGVSTFGVTEACVKRVTTGLTARGLETIQFHASGPGGKALESLVSQGVLAGVIDVTIHELADLMVGGVYSAGDDRLRGTVIPTVPRIIVPGALDFVNFWTGMVPERFAKREFLQFNAQNILMRTNVEELTALGQLVAERLNESKNPFIVLIPTLGFSENTKHMTHSLEGREIGSWAQPDTDRAFTNALRKHLREGRVEELGMHINDTEFADACVAKFLELMKITVLAEETNEQNHGG